MSLQLLFWMVYAISLILSVVLQWPIGEANRKPAGVIILLFLLVGILGWRTFGPAVHG